MNLRTREARDFAQWCSDVPASWGFLPPPRRVFFRPPAIVCACLGFWWRSPVSGRMLGPPGSFSLGGPTSVWLGAPALFQSPLGGIFGLVLFVDFGPALFGDTFPVNRGPPNPGHPRFFLLWGGPLPSAVGPFRVWFGGGGGLQASPAHRVRV